MPLQSGPAPCNVLWGTILEPVNLLQDAWCLGIKAAKSSSQAFCLHAPFLESTPQRMHASGGVRVRHVHI